LLDAIGRDDTLLDPTELFKADAKSGEIDAEDAAYWNVEGETVAVDEPLVDEPDPLIILALELGGTVTPINETVKAEISVEIETPARPINTVMAYLETVHLIADAAKWRRLQTALLHKLTDESLEISDLQAADMTLVWLWQNEPYANLGVGAWRFALQF